jgi:hypothetical protein
MFAPRIHIPIVMPRFQGHPSRQFGHLPSRRLIRFIQALLE